MIIQLIFIFTLLIATLLCVAIFSISLINSMIWGVPQVGTYGEAWKILQTQVLSKIPPGSKLLDLGSGTGRPARFFARHCGAQVTGYEIDPGNWLLANIFSKLQRISSVTFLRKNFFHLTREQLYTFDIVYIYLFPDLMDRIERELVPLMRPGTTIFVNSFAFPNLTPSEIIHRASGKPLFYIYRIS